VFALGPLSAIRSLVIIVGVDYGVAPSRLVETKLSGAFVLMLALEIVLNSLAARRPGRSVILSRRNQAKGWPPQKRRRESALRHELFVAEGFYWI
jgi:hypothetical protein